MCEPAGPSGLSRSIKRAHMEKLASWRREKYLHPELRRIFIEVTGSCNERCLHCGSRCEPGASPEVPSPLLLKTLGRVRDECDISRMMLCITGGEPLLRADFFDLMAAAADMGFAWGMTTNGTLITPQVARRLADCGMRTVSVSVDGLAATHDAFRSRTGSHDEALRGAANLLDVDAFGHVQVTTVVHRGNIGELDEMFEELDALPLDSWRLTAIEPIGRALEHPELMLRDDDYRRMFDFVRDMRAAGVPVVYGCCHYLGVDYEREVRDAYFLCNAGIYIASIMTNGDIGSCLDIERRAETIFGNVYRDDFVEVWRTRFESLRREPASLDERCSGCDERDFCAGGSWHSFDFAAQRQRVCMQNILF